MIQNVVSSGIVFCHVLITDGQTVPIETQAVDLHLSVLYSDMRNLLLSWFLISALLKFSITLSSYQFMSSSSSLGSILIFKNIHNKISHVKINCFLITTLHMCTFIYFSIKTSLLTASSLNVRSQKEISMHNLFTFLWTFYIYLNMDFFVNVFY